MRKMLSDCYASILKISELQRAINRDRIRHKEIHCREIDEQFVRIQGTGVLKKRHIKSKNCA